MQETMLKLWAEAQPMVWAAAVWLLAAAIRTGLQAWVAHVEAKEAAKRTAFEKASAKVAKSLVAVEQTMGEDIRNATADGKLSDEEKAKLWAEFLKLGGDEAKKEVGPYVTDAQAWLKAEAEALLAYLRNKAYAKMLGGAAPAAPVPPAGSPPSVTAGGSGGR